MASTIKFTAADGETIVGRIPRSWADVPLQPWVLLATAQNIFERLEAIAAITGVPYDFMDADVSRAAHVLQAMPWLYNGELPAAAEPAPVIEHLGRRYVYAGARHHLTAGQYEAFDSFLQTGEDKGGPLRVAHQLLACLYTPAVEAEAPRRRWWQLRKPTAPRPVPAPFTPESVEATAKAFETLPVSVAYPVLLHFFQQGSKSAETIRQFSAVAPAVLQALTALEQAQAAAGVSPACSLSFRPWLVATWIRHAKSLCSPSWSRFSFTESTPLPHPAARQPLNQN